MIITVNGADFSQCGLGKIVTIVKDDTKELIAKFKERNNPTNQKAMQNLFDRLGKGVNTSPWSKIRVLLIPFFAASIDEAKINLSSETITFNDTFDSNISLNKGKGIARKEGTKDDILIGLSKLDTNVFIFIDNNDMKSNAVYCNALGGNIGTVSSVVATRYTKWDEPNYSLELQYTQNPDFVCACRQGYTTNDKVLIATNLEKAEMLQTDNINTNSGSETKVGLFKNYTNNYYYGLNLPIIGVLETGTSYEEIMEIYAAIKEFKTSVI